MTTIPLQQTPTPDKGPLKKRSRLTDDEDTETWSEGLTIVNPEVESSSFIRDEAYYFSDGNCIILAENTLFNVHRSILSRDASSFSPLFMIPEVELKSEGLSDSNPIVLSGDTANEIRNFLWAMYSLPLEIKLLSDTQYDIPKLIDIAQVSNKYCFVSLERWACDVLEAGVAHLSFNLEDVESENRTQISRILCLAQSCRRASLLEATIRLLHQQLNTSPGRIAFVLGLCNEIETRVAPGCGETAIRDLVGAAHHAALLHGESFWNECQILLEPYTKFRVLAGYYRLTHQWAGIERGLDFKHSVACPDHRRCNTNWRSFCERIFLRSDSVTKLDLADIKGRLEAILLAFDQWGLKTGRDGAYPMCPGCKKNAAEGLQAKMKDFQDNLADYFPRH